jgi:alpha-tubulin suppressor-like RCC1 family protein
MLGSYDLVEIDTGLHINQISAGSAHVVCVDTQGQVYGWGKCNNG